MKVLLFLLEDVNIHKREFIDHSWQTTVARRTSVTTTSSVLILLGSSSECYSSEPPEVTAWPCQCSYTHVLVQPRTTGDSAFCKFFFFQTCNS